MSRPDLVRLSIRKIDRAIIEDRNLGNWKQRFDFYLQQQPEECRHKF